jgi:hypothetical protein
MKEEGGRKKENKKEGNKKDMKEEESKNDNAGSRDTLPPAFVDSDYLT